MSQALNAPNQIDSGISAGSSHQIEKPKSKGPRLGRQNSPIARVRGRQETQFISGFDGSVDGHSSLGTESPKTNTDDDDEYRLSGSDHNKDDSEQSILDEMRSLPQTTTNKKPGKAKYSSKPRGKRAAKAKTAPITAKKIGLPVTNKATTSTLKRPVAPNEVIQSPERLSISLDELSPTRQNMKDSVDSGSKRKERDVIPDSQDFVPDSQNTAVHVSSKTKVMNNRRPKKPFYEDNPGAQQTNSDPTTSVCNTTGTHQQSAVGQGKVSPANNTELQSEEVYFINQVKQTAPKTRRSAGTRPKGKDCVQPQVDKGKGRAIVQTQPLPTTYQIGSPPINQLSDQPSELIDTEYVEMHRQSSPSNYAEAEPSKPLGSSGPRELSVNEIEVTPVMKKSFKHVDFSTQAHLPQLSFGPVRLDNVVKTKNEATQTNTFEAQPLLQNVYYREEFEEGAIGNNTTKTKPWFLRSPRFQDASGPSRGNPILQEFERNVGKWKNQREIVLQRYPEISQIWQHHCIRPLERGHKG